MMDMRSDLIKGLLENFLQDLARSVTTLEHDDKIYFYETLTEYLKGVYNDLPDNEYFESMPFDEDAFIRQKLLARFREKMKPFIDSKLRLYFARYDKEMPELFQKLHLTEPVLNYEEYDDYISRVNAILLKIIENMYLTPKADETAGTKNLIQGSRKSDVEVDYRNSFKVTRPRQVTLLYYVFTLMGQKPRAGNKLIRLAEFGHILCGWSTNDVKNADLYKFLQRAPQVNNNPDVILKDLEFVKQQFERIEHAEGIELVQKEIDEVKRKQKKT